mmetsp:Transcript_69364/g.219486  ORF Transcript_69364/g.219486 Transcript_69364/m.219486 type:complete len:223 (-) Transcript_69364:548-1216(-)
MCLVGVILGRVGAGLSLPRLVHSGGNLGLLGGHGLLRRGLAVGEGGGLALGAGDLALEGGDGGGGGLAVLCGAGLQVRQLLAQLAHNRLHVGAGLGLGRGHGIRQALGGAGLGLSFRGGEVLHSGGECRHILLGGGRLLLGIAQRLGEIGDLELKSDLGTVLGLELLGEGILGILDLLLHAALGLDELRELAVGGSAGPGGLLTLGFDGGNLALHVGLLHPP